MKGRTRFIALALTIGLMLSLAVPAGAEVATVGIYFRGMTEREDGTPVQVPLTGSFQVLQGGMEKGVIQAGETTLTLYGSDPVTLVPMPETIEAGWNLADARITLNLTDGGNVTVPILVRPL